MKKKILSIFAVAILSFVLVGCGEAKLTLAENISTNVKTSETYLLQNVYSKTAGTDFNTSTAQSYVANDKLYVKLATEVNEEIKMIKIGDVFYESDKDVELSVGNTNKLTRKPFYVENKELYVSSILLQLNSGSTGMTSVSFPNNKIMPLSFATYETSQNKLTAELVNQGDGQLEKKLDGTYTFKSNKFDNSVFIKLKNGETDITADNLIIAQRVTDPGENNQGTSYTFGNAESPVGQTGYGVVFYPAYNNGTAYNQTTPKDHKILYNVYCVGVGTFSFEMNFDNTAQAQS